MGDMPSTIRSGVYALAIAAMAGVVPLWLRLRAADFPIIWPTLLGYVAAAAVILFPFLVFVWRGHNWARWVVIALVGLGVLSVITDWMGSVPSPIDWAVEALLVAVDLWGCYQLLSPSASTWLRREGAV